MSVFSYIQSTNTVSTNTLTFTAANTAGDVIVVANAKFTGALATSVTDSVGNTYLPLNTNNQGNITAFIATNIGAGTATVTFSGASGADTNYIIAEYKVPTSFIVGCQPNAGAIVTSTWVDIIDAFALGTLGTFTEAMMIPIVYATAGFGTWTLSTGTVRQFTHEPDSATLMLGDVDITLPGTATVTVTSTVGGEMFPYPINLIAYSVAASGGGIGFRSDWSGGFNG
jgi:hypothetical protein